MHAKRWLPRAAELLLLLLLVPLAAPAAGEGETNAPPVEGPEYSQLWGPAGEKWEPASRLPDFSFAGYRFGEKPIPELPQKADVKQFGAKGDGATDDTQAFLDAIAAVSNGAVFIPPGKYVITNIIRNPKSNLVLRGAGSGETILHFPRSLTDIRPDWTQNGGGRRTSRYSWSGGFLEIEGSIGAAELAAITGTARRGDRTFTVEALQPVEKGQRVQISLSDDEKKSFTKYLYSGDSGNIAHIKPASRHEVCRITAVEGNRITIDRPLRYDLRPEWKPRLCEFRPSVSDSGVENLTIEFPRTDYKGHFSELGLNAMNIHGVADCWVRNVHVVNSDSVVFLSGSFCTIRDLVVEGERSPPGHSIGHHGICLYGEDNLVSGFEFKAQYIHDITVSHSTGNVIADGKGPNVAFDHHCGAPYENLFTSIDVGKGTRIWSCGGGVAIGRNCGARETFWNIRSERPARYPGNFGPASMNFVGVESRAQSRTNAAAEWFEVIPPKDLIPQNLYEAQLARRLGK